MKLPYKEADKKFTMAVFKEKLCVCSSKTPVIYSIKLSEIPDQGQFQEFFTVQNAEDPQPPADVFICGVVNEKLLLSIARQHRFLLIDEEGKAIQVFLGIDEIQGRAAAVHNDVLYVADCRPSEGKYYVRKFEQSAKHDTKL